MVSVDPRLPWDAVMAILKEEDPRALIISPRFGMEDRAAALPTQFAAELERFTASRVYGYDTLNSKRFRGLKHIVQTGFDSVPGVVSLKDLHVAGLRELTYDIQQGCEAQASIRCGWRPSLFVCLCLHYCHRSLCVSLSCRR